MYSPAARVSRCGAPPVAAHLPQVSADRVFPAREGDPLPSGDQAGAYSNGTKLARRQAPRRPVRHVHDPHASHGLEGHAPPVGRGALPAGEPHGERRRRSGLRLRVGQFGDGALARGAEKGMVVTAPLATSTPRSLTTLGEHDACARRRSRRSPESGAAPCPLRRCPARPDPRARRSSSGLQVAQPERRAWAEGVPLPGDRAIGDAAHEGEPLAVGRDLRRPHAAARRLAPAATARRTRRHEISPVRMSMRRTWTAPPMKSPRPP